VTYPVLCIEDELVDRIAPHLVAAGISVVERVPHDGDCADLYLDCSLGEEQGTISLQPYIPGWHVAMFCKEPYRRPLLYDEIWRLLILLGAREEWPDEARL
jgi:hypothetical protein